MELKEVISNIELWIEVISTFLWGILISISIVLKKEREEREEERNK